MSTELKVLIAVIIVASIGLLSSPASPVKLGGSEYSVPFLTTATSSAVSIGTSDTLVQATTSRSYMVIVNDSSSVIYLKLDSDKAAVANQGIRLNASGGAYEMTADGGNLYNGAIRAIAVGSAGILTVTQR